MSERQPVRLLVLDDDDTVRAGKSMLGRFVHKVSDVEVFPEIPRLLRRYRQNGWRIVIVANQGGVAMGSLTMEDAAAIMRETCRQIGPGIVERAIFCPHFPKAPDPLMRTCWCRKPRAGMVIDAAFQLLEVHPEESYPPSIGLMVGDREEDAGCADAAALPFMWANEWRAGAHDPTS